MTDHQRSLGARIYAALFRVYGQAQISAPDAPATTYPDIVPGTLAAWDVRHAEDGSTYLVAPAAGPTDEPGTARALS